MNEPATPQIRRVATTVLPTPAGTFTCHAFEDDTGETHLALVAGDVEQATDPVLVRLHSECLTGDVFGSRRCDCGPQLEAALDRIAEAGTGVVVYLCGHEGRGIGLGHKLRAYELQDAGVDTVDANLALGFPVDLRRYDVGAAILRELGVGRVRVMTNNPAKVASLRADGIEVVEAVAHRIEPTPENRRYLDTKRDRLGHDL